MHQSAPSREHARGDAAEAATREPSAPPAPRTLHPGTEDTLQGRDELTKHHTVLCTKCCLFIFMDTVREPSLIISTKNIRSLYIFLTS